MKPYRPNVDRALPVIAPNQSVDDPPRDDYDTPEEIKERAEFAAELEALLDAAAANGEDSDIEEFLRPTQSQQDTVIMADRRHEHGPDADSDSSEDSFAVYSDSDEENVSPSGSQNEPASPQLQQGPLLSTQTSSQIQPPAVSQEESSILNTAARHTQPTDVAEPSTPPQNRVKRTPVSPIKRFVAQQFLSQQREDIRALIDARGSHRDIPDPRVVMSSYRRTRLARSKPATVKKTLEPAKDSKEVLVKLMNEVDQDHK